jgi:hypothetical protein
MSDAVEKPAHYNQGSVETIDGIRAALGVGFLAYCLGNVLKYVWRCQSKGKLLEDLRKAEKYLQWAIEEAEKLEPKSEPANYLEIPEGWRELREGEPRHKADMFLRKGEWVGYTDGHDPAKSGFPKYDKIIHFTHIRKIEPSNSPVVPNSSKLNTNQVECQACGLNTSGKTWCSAQKPGCQMPDHPPVKGSTTEPETVVEEKWVPKIGDKVRVIKPRVVNDSNPHWHPEMDQFDGRLGEVSKAIHKLGVVLIDGFEDRDGYQWRFSFDWLVFEGSKIEDAK